MSALARTLSPVTEHWPHRWDERKQDVLNARPVPARFYDARWQPIPVTARIVWERDGPQTIDTRAEGWTSALVLVLVGDPRARHVGYWLDLADVQRR